MGLLGSLLRGLAVRRPEPGAVQAPRDERLLELARRAEEALSRVELPGYDVDIVSAGLVRRIRVARTGDAVMVLLDYTGSDPGCNFCRFISRAAWAKIVSEAERRLREAGFREVLLVDAATMLPIRLGADD